MYSKSDLIEILRRYEREGDSLPSRRDSYQWQMLMDGLRALIAKADQEQSAYVEAPRFT